MIQSVGMTKRQLRQMLIFEGLYYAVITWLFPILPVHWLSASASGP